MWGVHLHHDITAERLGSGEIKRMDRLLGQYIPWQAAYPTMLCVPVLSGGTQKKLNTSNILVLEKETPVNQFVKGQSWARRVGSFRLWPSNWWIRYRPHKDACQSMVSRVKVQKKNRDAYTVNCSNPTKRLIRVLLRKNVSAIRGLVVAVSCSSIIFTKTPRRSNALWQYYTDQLTFMHLLWSPLNHHPLKHLRTETGHLSYQKMELRFNPLPGTTNSSSVECLFTLPCPDAGAGSFTPFPTNPGFQDTPR